MPTLRHLSRAARRAQFVQVPEKPARDLIRMGTGSPKGTYANLETDARQVFLCFAARSCKTPQVFAGIPGDPRPYVAGDSTGTPVSV